MSVILILRQRDIKRIIHKSPAETIQVIETPEEDDKSSGTLGSLEKAWLDKEMTEWPWNTGCNL